MELAGSGRESRVLLHEHIGLEVSGKLLLEGEALVATGVPRSLHLETRLLSRDRHKCRPLVEGAQRDKRIASILRSLMGRDMRVGITNLRVL